MSQQWLPPKPAETWAMLTDKASQKEESGSSVHRQVGQIYRTWGKVETKQSKVTNLKAASQKRQQEELE